MNNPTNGLRAILYGTMLRLRREEKGRRFSLQRIKYEVNSFSTRFQYAQQAVDEALHDLRETYNLTLDFDGHRLGWRLEDGKRHNRVNK